MDRTHVRRCIEAGERTCGLLRRLSLDADAPSTAAYWLSLAKAVDASLAGLSSLAERAPGRDRPVEPAVSTGDVAEALAALLDAADTLAAQWPHLLADQVPLEVPSPAHERRRAARRGSPRRYPFVRHEGVLGAAV